MEIEIVFGMLIAFQLKHLLADYYLQFPYMHKNKGQITGWVGPLKDHALVHAFFTMVIVSVVLGMYSTDPVYVLVAGAFDFGTHFVIDRWKARGTTDTTTDKFWYRLGIDQMLHHIVTTLIVIGLYYVIK